MDHDFWHERWQRRDIGFHQPHIHEQLQRFWPSLRLAPESTVFVPLCGKSRDMVWLATKGHRIIGIELSDIAVREFFDEGGQTPQRTRAGAFDISSAGPFTIYRGDFFELPAEVLSGVAAVYDRAALIALPPAMRPRYAETLARILPENAVIFLIAIDYPDGEITGPPFAVSGEEIARLFGGAFSIDILERRDGLSASDNLKRRGVTRLEETAYLLKRRPGGQGRAKT
jgi:thiopurine S-methyltransferase